MSDPTTTPPDQCPKPFWHKTHHYCPWCTFVSEEAKMRELEAKTIAAMQARELNDRWNKATSRMTCGGSEFINDPETTANYVEKSRRMYHELTLKRVKELRQARRERDELAECIRNYCNGCDFQGEPECCQCALGAAPIRRSA